VALTARDFEFAPAALQVPAGRPFRIAFTNDDAGIPHNVVIRSAAGGQLFSGTIVSGRQTVTYSVGALPAGSYLLACIVHPAMAATLTAN